MPRFFLVPILVAVLLPVSLYAQTLAETEQQFIRGEYSDAIAAAQKRLEERPYSEEWRAMLVRSLMTVGRYHEAYTNAHEGLSGYPRTIRMLLLARQTALYQNDLTGANTRLTEIRNLIERRPPVYPNGDALIALGEALLLLGVEPRLVLENCFRRAERLPSPPRDAFISSGQLALDKNDFKLASDVFRDGLGRFGADPDLHCGLAKAFQTSNREEMIKHLESALEANANHVPSLLLFVDHLIDGEQYEEADRYLARVLRVNPHQPEALAYRALMSHLRNQPEREQEFRAAALQFYQTNPQVDHLIGLKLSRKYRFAEGAAAQRRALDFEPEFTPARRQLAEDLLRLGQTDEGWRLAKAVHQSDAYDVTAYNLSLLHDTMMKFRTLTNGDFIVRMSEQEAELYGDRVLDLLKRAKAALCTKYGVQLTEPTVVEIFPKQSDFAVRTFGMPGNPGYLGVCFGSVITANSPASQAPNPANWEDVLWHEFCHVVTLNATRNRMPRWLSEGISVYEERQAHPTWGERMNLEYRDMILKGGLTPLGRLSSAFLTATNSARLQFAYYESSLVVEFIIEKFGLDGMRRILRDLHAGAEVNTAITAHTAPLPTLEKDFANYARALAENLAPGINLEKPPVTRSSAARITWEGLNPGNYYVRLRNAAELMEAKKWAEAKPALESLAKDYAGEKREDNPLWLLAAVHRNLGETNAEFAVLKQLAGREDDFVLLFTRLIELAQQQQDWQSVTNYADRLLAVNPLISLPHRAMAKAGLALGAHDTAINAHRKLLLLDPPDPADVHYQLASLLHRHGNDAAMARRHVLQALEEAPRFRDAQQLLLDLHSKDSGNAAPATTPPAPIR